MRTSILLGTAALLLATAARDQADNVRGDLYVAQGMTGSAGTNPSTTAVSPRTEPGPDRSHDEDGHPPRTSLDNGTGSPLAGDELDQPRPNADARSDDAAVPKRGVPTPRDGGR